MLVSIVIALSPDLEGGSPNKAKGKRMISHGPFTPKGGVLEGKSPAISGKSRLVKYYSIWPDLARFWVQVTVFRLKLAVVYP